MAHHAVVDGAILQRNLQQIAACFFHCLLHGSRHFLGLALAHADAAIAVTHDGQCSEAENTTALDHFGDAVHRDHLLAHAVFGTVTLRFRSKFSHF